MVSIISRKRGVCVELSLASSVAINRVKEIEKIKTPFSEKS